MTQVCRPLLVAPDANRAARVRDAILRLSEIRDFTLDGLSPLAEQFIDLAIERLLEAGNG